MIAADPAQFSIWTVNGPCTAGVCPVFGRPPVVGAEMSIDHPLLHGPRLARISLVIAWQKFPQGRGGLGGYYKAYRVDPPVRNSSFIVTITAPLSGWTRGRQRRLFPAGAVSRFDLAANGRRDTGGTPVTLTLAAPAQSFGNAGYSNALMAASLRLAEDGHAALPNPPWLPVAAISLYVTPA